MHDPENPYKDQYDEEVVISVSDWYHDQMPGLIDFFMSKKDPGGAEPVGVDVHQRHAGPARQRRVLAGDHEGRRGDPTGDAEAPREAAYQRRLPGAHSSSSPNSRGRVGRPAMARIVHEPHHRHDAPQ